MRFKVLSDIHTEHHADLGESWARNLQVENCDAIVIAGDLGTKSNLVLVLTEVCAHGVPVVYVQGNHEFYNCERTEMQEIRRSLSIPNLHWLDAEMVELGGVRILGTSLWFPYDPMNFCYESGVRDFSRIPNFREWVYTEHERSVQFLKENLREGDMVVTHHLPSYKSVPPQYKTSISNRFYVSNMENLIVERKPAVWIHGHTHSSLDFCLGETRIVCNPYGYQGYQLNDDFKDVIIGK